MLRSWRLGPSDGWVEAAEQFEGAADLGQCDGDDSAVGGEQGIDRNRETVCPTAHHARCCKKDLGVEAGGDARAECDLDESLGVQSANVAHGALDDVWRTTSRYRQGWSGRRRPSARCGVCAWRKWAWPQTILH
jgi:hypothetical protein